MLLYEIKQVSKSFQTGGETITPVDHLDLTVTSGAFISIGGSSGSGKSTLLLMMGGLLRPDSGSIQWQGKDLAALDANERARKIGYMFQRAQLVQALTLEENLRLSQAVSGNSEASVDEMLERLGLLEQKHSLPRHLSGGQQRRAVLAATWARNPAVFLLDEPTNDLDHHWAEVVMDMIRTWQGEGKAIVLATHNQQYASMADACYTMEQGRLLCESAPR